MATEPDVFDRIRSACAAVAAASIHVRVKGDMIPGFAAGLDLDPARFDDPGQEPIGDAESTAAFVMAIDAINFGSGYFPLLKKRPGHSGYHTVAASVRDLVTATGPLTAERLSAWTLADAAATFDQALDGGPIEELMGHFVTAWNDLGGFAERVGGGSFLGVVEAAGHSAATLVGLLDSMPLFHDVHHHRAVGEVPLYKRAQITAQDLAVAFGHEGPGYFADLDRLTMFADNLVPHVLRVDGVLEFSAPLLRRIAAVDDITVGSPEEVEIRACGVHAVELIRAELAAGGTDIRSADLDNVLWNQGGDARYKAVPRHRTRCVFY